jgi:hypothetical protein
MVVFKSANLKAVHISEVVATRAVSTKLVIDFQLENVGKAIARNPALQYDLDVPLNQQEKVSSHGIAKFIDDPPATPVEARVVVEVSSEFAQRDGATLHYKIAYDDEATGIHFEEKTACVETYLTGG